MRLGPDGCRHVIGSETVPLHPHPLWPWVRQTRRICSRAERHPNHRWFEFSTFGKSELISSVAQ